MCLVYQVKTSCFFSTHQQLGIQGVWRGKNKQTTRSRDDQKQMLNYISEQRLTQVKSLQQGRELLKYYLNKNQLVSSQCLLDDRHLEKLFNIVNLLGLF